MHPHYVNSSSSPRGPALFKGRSCSQPISCCAACSLTRLSHGAFGYGITCRWSLHSEELLRDRNQECLDLNLAGGAQLAECYVDGTKTRCDQRPSNGLTASNPPPSHVPCSRFSLDSNISRKRFLANALRHAQVASSTRQRTCIALHSRVLW